MQRRVAVRVARPGGHVGRVRQQQFDDLWMAEERREMQRRPPVVAERVDRAPRREQPLDRIEFTGRARLEQAQPRSASDEQVRNFFPAIVDSG